jgi:1-phosphatidylinositol-4-phosphate 5-kinase
LKGSLFGRELPESSTTDNPQAVMKDLNWLKLEKKLFLGSEKSQLLVMQLERDVKVMII